MSTPPQTGSLSSRARSSSPSDPIALRLALPYPIGAVNAYLMPGDPLTLVDAGAGWRAGEDALEQALAAHGRRVADIELLLLTHHHDDHAGLAQTVRERSGCVVAAHELVADLLADEPATRAAEDAHAEALLRRHGAPAAVVATVAERSRFAAAFVSSVDVDRRLRDGDRLTAGSRELTVHLRPGHSPADTLFVDGRGHALSGDHLLDAAPTALVAEPAAGGADGPFALPPLMTIYRDSLAATRALGLTRALPGHGPPIDDVGALIDRRLSEQETRAAAVRAALDAPATAWELVERLWPGRRLDSTDHPISIPFIVLCGVLSHLELLVAREQVRPSLGDDGLARFASV